MKDAGPFGSYFKQSASNRNFLLPIVFYLTFHLVLQYFVPIWGLVIILKVYFFKELEKKFFAKV